MLDSSARTHTLTYRVRKEKMDNNEVTIVMVCNGLMTSSKGLQQLSCYSKLLLEWNKALGWLVFGCSPLAAHCLNLQQNIAVGVNFQVIPKCTHNNFHLTVLPLALSHCIKCICTFTHTHHLANNCMALSVAQCMIEVRTNGPTDTSICVKYTSSIDCRHPAVWKLATFVQQHRWRSSIPHVARIEYFAAMIKNRVRKLNSTNIQYRNE